MHVISLLGTKLKKFIIKVYYSFIKEKYLSIDRYAIFVVLTVIPARMNFENKKLKHKIFLLRQCSSFTNYFSLFPEKKTCVRNTNGSK